MTTSCTKCEWPRSERWGKPYEPSSRVRFHRITVLSREDDRRMSELSMGVAMEVTQPSCLRTEDE